MTNALKKFAVFVTAGVVYLIGQYMRGIWFEKLAFNTCNFSYDSYGVFCNSFFAQNLGWPLIAAGQTLAIVGIILLFANQDGFRKWLKFSFWYVPIAVIFVIWFSPGGFIGLPGASTPDYAHTVWDFGYLYILITLVIVVQSWWRGRRAVVGKL